MQGPGERDRVGARIARLDRPFGAQRREGRDDPLELGDAGFEVGPAQIAEGDGFGRRLSVELRGLHDH